MKCFQFKYLLVVTISVLLISLVGLCGCVEDTFVAPEYVEADMHPIEVTIDQLYTEYMADETTAAAKYRGERLLFKEVEVEEVVGRTYIDRHGEATFLNEYFTSGHARFIELRDFLVVMQNIKVGYVLNIIGESEGLKHGVIYISDCWVESVIGDLGKGGTGVSLY